MADKPLPGYDTSFGNHKAEVIDHYGPASYVTGGETFSASQLGWGGIEFALPCNMLFNSTPKSVFASISGTYYVEVSLATTTAPGGAVSSVTIKWYVVATGNEVANAFDLSAQVVRLFMLGC